MKNFIIGVVIVIYMFIIMPILFLISMIVGVTYLKIKRIISYKF